MRIAPLLLAAVSLAACSAGEEKTEAPPADREARQRGQKLLAQYQCGSCHLIPGVPAAGGKVAGSLEGFGRRSYIAGRLPNNAPSLAAWIVDPAAASPGATMPSMGVEAAQAHDMAAYLLALE